MLVVMHVQLSHCSSKYSCMSVGCGHVPLPFHCFARAGRRGAQVDDCFEVFWTVVCWSGPCEFCLSPSPHSSPLTLLTLILHSSYYSSLTLHSSHSLFTPHTHSSHLLCIFYPSPSTFHASLPFLLCLVFSLTLTSPSPSLPLTR